jgi:hypothetical protein
VAKLTANHSHPVDSFFNGNAKYTLRSDGMILQQLRIDGRLERPRRFAHFTDQAFVADGWEQFKRRMSHSI